MTDTVRYPPLGRAISVGDIIQECLCGCTLVYDFGIWHLVNCPEHEWKLET